MIDATHDVNRRSWVESANGHPDFPIQNLPFGYLQQARRKAARRRRDRGRDLRPQDGERGRPVLRRGEARRRRRPAARGSTRCSRSAPARARRCGRGSRTCSMPTAASGEQVEGMKPLLLTRAADCDLHLPARIGGFTDFYAGIHHATNSGRLLRPDNPLLPNYKHIPVAYHGRASSIRRVGHRRCAGQAASASRRPRPSPTSARAAISTTSSSLGVWIGPGNALGAPIPIGAASDARRRLLPAQRLVGARHPGLGIPAARSVPRQELRHRRCRPGW